MSAHPLLVAHRAGNRPDTARAAQHRADLVEVDVHVFRGRVEVRHEKVLRPTARLWEKWYLLPRGTSPFTIQDVLAVIEPDTHLQVDLKCYTPWAARRIRASLPDSQPVTVSARSWWVLRAFRDRPGTPRLRSCKTRLQLRLAQLVPGLGDQLGLVVHQRLLDEGVVRSVTAKTPWLFTWAVETPERGRALAAAGVTALIVDDLDLDWPRPD